MDIIQKGLELAIRDDEIRQFHQNSSDSWLIFANLTTNHYFEFHFLYEVISKLFTMLLEMELSNTVSLSWVKI